MNQPDKIPQLTEPRVFRPRPSTLKKRIFAAVGLASAVSLTMALTGQGPVEYRPPMFAVGVTGLAFAIRFFTMQLGRTVTTLTLQSDGIVLSTDTSRSSIPWADLSTVIYKAGRNGHRWQFVSKTRPEPFEFYLDGLGFRQTAELEQLIRSIQTPEIKVALLDLPFGLSDAA